MLLLVGRSAWAIWFQFGPVQIQARPSLRQMTGPALSSAGPDTLVVASFFAEPVFHSMLRCTFGGTFTPTVKVVHTQVTANPPTNNPDATAVLEL